MNLSVFLTFSPIEMVLSKWTALLAIGWILHGALRNSHPRWRLILWRTTLCLGILLPLAHLTPAPLLQVPVASPTNPIQKIAAGNSIGASGPTAAPSQATSQSQHEVKATVSASHHPILIQETKTTSAFEWRTITFILWGTGILIGVFRLIWLNACLSQIRTNTAPANKELNELAKAIQARLGIRRNVEIRVSDLVSSPFVCGLWNPAVILPRALVQNFQVNTLSALLGHELAHLRGHDLFWCVSWRWMAVVFWFHPLVWRIPNAHSLACEQEADRLASGQLNNRESYPQLLAQLALRVLKLPAVESHLVVNGSSQISQRLHHLKNGAMGEWTLRRRVIGTIFATVLISVTAGWQFTQSSAAETKADRETVFNEVIVVVEDEEGRPIEGATITPDGLRVKGPRSVDHYGWDPQLHGPRSKVVTDHEGKAIIKYPVVTVAEEKLLTGQISFSVLHPDYAPARPTQYPVDAPAGPIRLERGIRVEVSGYYGKDRQPLTELVANISGDRPTKNWEKKANGSIEVRELAPGGHMVQLMGQLPSGEIVYSEAFAFTAEKGQKYQFALEMKPGIRLEGRLDSKVPRPVKNGRVVISVRPKEFPALVVPEDLGELHARYGGSFQFWTSYRPIAEDGSFVFESIPSGEVDVIVHGDGFVSLNGGEPKNRVPANSNNLKSRLTIGVPQAFPLSAPVTQIEVVTEPTVTLEVTTKTQSGAPISGAHIYLNPNVMRIQTGIFGDVNPSSEEPFRKVEPLPAISYSGTTGKDGKVIIRNVPSVSHGLDIHHPEFQIPLSPNLNQRHIDHHATYKKNHVSLDALLQSEAHVLVDRYVRFRLEPGVTRKLQITMQKKGSEFIGDVR